MKKMLIFSIVLLAFIACSKTDGFETTFSSPGVELRAPTKILVCHFDLEESAWQLKNINVNALPSHLAHGDVRLDDQDNDGFLPDNECLIGPAGDFNDLDSTIYPGAIEICGDGIDQDCDGSDLVCLSCICFTSDDLYSLLDIAWPFGWWMDPSCLAPPYDHLEEVYLVDGQTPGGKINAGANTIDFGSSKYVGYYRFNHNTQSYDDYCYQSVSVDDYLDCKALLQAFILDLKEVYPDRDRCVLFPPAIERDGNSPGLIGDSELQMSNRMDAMARKLKH